MPWCPKCKTEYRKGVTVCADCGSGLVEEQPAAEYNYVPLKVMETQEIAEKLIKYLEYLKLDSHYEYSEEELGFMVLVREEELKKAQKAFLAFYEVESKQIEAQQLASKATAANNTRKAKDEKAFNSTSEEYAESKTDEEVLDSDEDEDFDEDFDVEEDFDKSSEIDDLEHEKRKVTKMMYSSGSYEKKDEKAKEMQSTAVTFFVFGILGLTFIVLNLLKVINLINGIIPYIMMSAMFIGFILVGINSVGRAKKAAKEAIVEEENTKKITNFLDAAISEETLSSMKDPSLSEEGNFIRVMEGIKTLVIMQFGELDDAYLDYVTEEFYNNRFEV